MSQMVDRETLKDRFEHVEGVFEVAFRNHERAKRRNKGLAMQIHVSQGRAALEVMELLARELCTGKGR